MSVRDALHELPADTRDREFLCETCGYEVHADVNAAINIAQTEP